MVWMVHLAAVDASLCRFFLLYGSCSSLSWCHCTALDIVSFAVVLSHVVIGRVFCTSCFNAWAILFLIAFVLVEIQLDNLVVCYREN